MIAPLIDRDVHLQKCIVARTLDINQVRHWRDLFQMPESTANALATVKCAYLRCHVEDPLENSLKQSVIQQIVVIDLCLQPA